VVVSPTELSSEKSFCYFAFAAMLDYCRLASETVFASKKPKFDIWSGTTCHLDSDFAATTCKAEAANMDKTMTMMTPCDSFRRSLTASSSLPLLLRLSLESFDHHAEPEKAMQLSPWVVLQERWMHPRVR